MKRSLLIFLIVFCIIQTVSAQTQPKPSFFDNPGEVIVPVNYDANRKYPLILIFPYTTGTAFEFFRRYVSILPEEAFYYLPPGRPDRSHYLPDFISYVSWFEERLFTDIEVLLSRYSVDLSEVYMMGYSLGGDITWAMAARNPWLAKAFVVAGSRSSYPISTESIREMRNRGVQAEFLIGTIDSQARRSGIYSAYNLLSNSRVRSGISEYNGGHDMPPHGSFDRIFRNLF